VKNDCEEVALRVVNAVEEARVAKKLVVVALVVVEFKTERLRRDDDALTMIPMVAPPFGVMTVVSVVVAHFDEEPLAPHVIPVFERSPIEEKVAQPGVPPADETIKLVVEAVVAEREVVVAFVKSPTDAWMIRVKKLCDDVAFKVLN
jgi:hypothetical protein